MRAIGLRVAVWILLGAMPLAAQQPAPSGSLGETPLGEVSVGYNYVRTKTVNSSGCCFNMNGGSASIAINFNNRVGLVQEFGGYHSGNVRNTNFSLDVFTYTIGPRLSFRGERATVFVHGLFGGSHASGTLYTQGFQQGSAQPTPQDSFAMLLGGGLDIKAGSRFAIRVVGADWMFTKLPNGDTNRQHSLRINSGIVLRFGSR